MPLIKCVLNVQELLKKWFLILRYFVNYNSVKNHVRNVNGKIDKNHIFINMDDEIYLVEKLNKSKYYLISKKLIEIYAEVFYDYDKINIKKKKIKWYREAKV